LLGTRMKNASALLMGSVPATVRQVRCLQKSLLNLKTIKSNKKQAKPAKIGRKGREIPGLPLPMRHSILLLRNYEKRNRYSNLFRSKSRKS